jgi:hypothetical protein
MKSVTYAGRRFNAAGGATEIASDILEQIRAGVDLLFCLYVKTFFLGVLDGQSPANRNCVSGTAPKSLCVLAHRLVPPSDELLLIRDPGVDFGVGAGQAITRILGNCFWSET